ncbi:MAG TPA: metalloregulator ArsR/SmtB family transcription factor [Candidatus Tyrphobacter sp.]
MPAAAKVSLVMQALSDPTRRGIYERILTAGETTVGALTTRARVSQPAISQHVKALQEARLIVGRRAGRQTFYRAESRGLVPLAEWMRQYRRFWETRFDRLDDYLKTLQTEGKHARK